MSGLLSNKTRSNIGGNFVTTFEMELKEQAASSLLEEFMEKGIDGVELEEAFRWLSDGYMSYVTDIVKDRALIGIDGLKPSQRRGLFTMLTDTKAADKEVKASKAVADALRIHPHGDSAMYLTMVRMHRDARYLNMPLTEGEGFFGKVHSTDAPAAMRYTYLKLTKEAMEFFRGMQGVPYKKLEDGDGFEPEYLPVSFPSALANPSSGIAVGVASNILPYNLNELNNATIELIRTGTIKEPLMPDFTTGGELVLADSDLGRIMKTGKGKVVVRGKWTVDGKKIRITEFPYNVTVQGLKESIDNANIQGVSRVYDGEDYEEGMSLIVECSNKNVVQDVTKEILRITELQKTFHANNMIILNDAPVLIGTLNFLKEWVSFRKGVIIKQTETEKDVIEKEMQKYVESLPFLRDFDAVDGLVDIMRSRKFRKELKSKAREYVGSKYPEISDSTFDWLWGLQVPSFYDIEGKENTLAGLEEKHKDLVNVLGAPEEEIIRQLQELNETFVTPRLTHPTDVAYDLTKPEKIEVKVSATSIAVEVDGLFIKKVSPHLAAENAYYCMSDDVMAYIDNRGRVFRVYLEDLPLSSSKEKGTYLPVYLSVPDDFEIVYYDLLQDKKVGFVYEDGFVSVVNFGEWYNNSRVLKVTTKGVSPHSGLIMHEFDPDNNKGVMMAVTKKGKFGFFKLDFKEKDRRARTRLIPLSDEDDKIVDCAILSDLETTLIVDNPTRYFGKLKRLQRGDKLNLENYKALFSRA